MLSIKTSACAGLFRASTSVETMQNFMAELRRPRRVQLISPENTAQQTRTVAQPSPAASRANAAFDQLLARAAASRAAQQASGGASAQPGAQPGGHRKIGRNDPCPCGSGKKYKNCHGKN